MATPEDQARIEKLEYEEERARPVQRMETIAEEGGDYVIGVLRTEIGYLKQDIRDLIDLQETRETEAEQAKQIAADHAREVAALQARLDAKNTKINSLRSAQSTLAPDNLGEVAALRRSFKRKIQKSIIFTPPKQHPYQTILRKSPL